MESNFFFFCPIEILQMKAFLLLKKSLSGETFSVCQETITSCLISLLGMYASGKWEKTVVNDKRCNGETGKQKTVM